MCIPNPFAAISYDFRYRIHKNYQKQAKEYLNHHRDYYIKKILEVEDYDELKNEVEANVKGKIKMDLKMAAIDNALFEFQEYNGLV